jgi:hypothetical protein
VTRIEARPAIAGPGLLASIALLALLAVPSRPALAGEPGAEDKALAEVLFRDGRKLASEGKVAAGCEKLAESQRIDPKLGTLLNLADCHEKEGRTASAWAEFTEAASVATNTDQEERAQFAKTHAADLERRMSRLSIEVTAPILEMRIALNERTIRLAAIGSHIPVDPGEYAIKVTAPGKKPWSERISIAPGPSTKKLSIPALKDDDIEADPSSPSDPPSSASGGLSPLFIAGMITAGVGLGGLGVGTGFGLRTLSKASDAEQSCKGAVCTPAGLEANHAAYTSAAISTIAFSAGFAFSAAGAVLMILKAPSKAARKVGDRVWMMPEFGREGGRITLGGQW